MKLKALLMPVVLGALVLGACGKKEEPKPADTTAPAVTPAPEPAPAPAPAPMDTMKKDSAMSDTSKKM